MNSERREGYLQGAVESERWRRQIELSTNVELALMGPESLSLLMQVLFGAGHLLGRRIEV